MKKNIMYCIADKIENKLSDKELKELINLKIYNIIMIMEFNS